MKRNYDRISPSDSAGPVPAGPTPTCGSVVGPTLLTVPCNPDPAAEVAMFEACQVSAMLAAAAMSLTNLTPEALPRLLRRP
jgi:hypothetical protein